MGNDNQGGVVMATANKSALVKIQSALMNPNFTKRFTDTVPPSVRETMSPNRMMNVTLRAMQKLPALMKCSQDSILQGVLDGAMLGLEVSGPLQHAALIPYKGKAQLQVEYRGWLELARRTGEFLGAPIVMWVCKNDKYELDVTDHEKPIKHQPCVIGERGDKLFCYCLTRFKGGGIHFEMMTLAEIKDHRKRYANKSNEAWENSFGEMGKKTVIIRAAKKWPLSAENSMALRKAVQVDIEAAVDYDLETGEVLEDAEPEPETVDTTSTELSELAVECLDLAKLLDSDPGKYLTGLVRDEMEDGTVELSDADDGLLERIRKTLLERVQEKKKG